MPGRKAVSTLHRPKNEILSFFKFLQKKVSRLDKKVPAHFCTTFGVVICKNHVGKHLDLISAEKLFYHAEKLFSAEI